MVLGESYLNRRDVRDPALHAESQNIFIYFYHLAPSISHLALALYYQDSSGLADSCRTVGKWWSKMAVSPACFLAQLCPAHSKRSDKYKAGSNLLLWFFRSSVLWPYMANLRAKALYSGFVHSDHESWQVSCTYLERLGDSCWLRCCVKRLDYHMNIVSITNGNDPTYSLIWLQSISILKQPQPGSTLCPILSNDVLPPFCSNSISSIA